jgi:hypothetical protein
MVCLGSNVIRFLQSYIGDEAFRTGLVNNFAEYANKNTRTENLWSHLNRSSKQLHLSDILSMWIRKMGILLLDTLTKFIRDGTFSPQDRLDIGTDIYASTCSGHINYINYLKLLHQTYKSETNLTVWHSIY